MIQMIRPAMIPKNMFIGVDRSLTSSLQVKLTIYKIVITSNSAMIEMMKVNSFILVFKLLRVYHQLVPREL